MTKINAIIRKEWGEVFKNRFVLFTVAFLPLILTAIPLIILGSTQDLVGIAGSAATEFPAQFTELCQGMSGGECTQYLLVSQFILLFMMMPVMIPVTIASYSIVGEKTTRTLEPVLATPIRTIELLIGKALAAIIPALIATWGSYLIFTLGAKILTTSSSVASKLFDPLWILAIFLVGPLLSVASVSIAVMVSSRVSDPRVAEQISALVVLPVLGLFISQSMGLIFLNEELILWIAAAMLIIDGGLLAFATQLFQRESILTRWK